MTRVSCVSQTKKTSQAVLMAVDCPEHFGASSEIIIPDFSLDEWLAKDHDSTLS